MTAPPLPDTSCVRVRIDYQHDTGLKGGNRFYLSYSGTAPTGANCVTLATDIAGFWNTSIMSAINPDWTNVEIDVLDITTPLGLSGSWTGSNAGTESGTPMPAQTAMNIEFGIARRYRGGKPRFYLPPSSQTNAASDVAWDQTFINQVATNVGTVMSNIEALTIGGMGTLQHINLSFYDGFTNVENTSGRMRAAPKYRVTALSDKVTGYFGKTEIGSQRRRRAATTF